MVCLLSVYCDHVLTNLQVTTGTCSKKQEVIQFSSVPSKNTIQFRVALQYLSRVLQETINHKNDSTIHLLGFDYSHGLEYLISKKMTLFLKIKLFQFRNTRFSRENFLVCFTGQRLNITLLLVYGCIQCCNFAFFSFFVFFEPFAILLSFF